MERKGTEVTYYQSEGDDKEFKRLTTFAFVADDVKAVQLFGETSSPKAALEVRFTDLHIAAKALVPKSAAPKKRPVEPTPKVCAAGSVRTREPVERGGKSKGDIVRTDCATEEPSKEFVLITLQTAAFIE